MCRKVPADRAELPKNIWGCQAKTWPASCPSGIIQCILPWTLDCTMTCPPGCHGVSCDHRPIFDEKSPPSWFLDQASACRFRTIRNLQWPFEQHGQPSHQTNAQVDLAARRHSSPVVRHRFSIPKMAHRSIATSAKASSCILNIFDEVCKEFGLEISVKKTKQE